MYCNRNIVLQPWECRLARFCIAGEGFEWLKLYCNRVLYCNRMARLAWVKTVSRYNYCIVTEAVGMVLVRFVLQYTYVYCDRQGSQAAGLVSQHGTIEGHDTAARHAAQRCDTAPCAHDKVPCACDTTALTLRHGRLTYDTTGGPGCDTAKRARLGAPVRTWVGWLHQKAVHLVHPSCF